MLMFILFSERYYMYIYIYAATVFMPLLSILLWELAKDHELRYI